MISRRQLIDSSREEVESKIKEVISLDYDLDGRKIGEGKYLLFSRFDHSYGGTISTIDAHDFTIDLTLRSLGQKTELSYKIRGSSTGLVMGTVFFMALFPLFLFLIPKPGKSEGTILLLFFILFFFGGYALFSIQI